MSHSLERLIRLVKKTGDTLVVHDAVHGQDVVLLNIERYEDLVDIDATDNDWHRLGDILEQKKEATEMFTAPQPVFDSAPSENTESYLEDVSSAGISSPTDSVQVPSEIEELRYEIPVEENQASPSTFASHSIHQKIAGEQPIFSPEEPLPKEGPVFFEEPV